MAKKRLRKLNESDKAFMGNIVKAGEVDVKKPFKIEWFDEDDGWQEKTVRPGTYEYRLLNVRGWKPRQLKIDGEWFDVNGDCEELEEVLAEVKEETTVANIAPTVDYLGHVEPVEYLRKKGMEILAGDYDDPDADSRKKKDDDDSEWVSPIGRIIAGESVRKVIGEQVGIF